MRRCDDPAIVGADLIGRSREVTALVQMLEGDDAVRLVTVTGPAGVGKTRVASAVAERIQHDGARVARVELGPLQDPGLVAEAVAAAVGSDEAHHGSALEAAAAALGDAPILLVLDNFEHLGPAAGVVAALLDAAPGARMIVTSRHVLGLSAEHMFPLAPLSLPAPDEHDLERGRRCESVALFVERARARDPGFALTDDVAPSVFEICRRLDGLPLAIELVAARVATLPPPALVARWEDVAGLDAPGALDLPPRQRTLRRALDWSYDLLEPAERALLRRLAAFPGGFGLTAVEAACGGWSDVLPALEVQPIAALGRLVDRSLVERAEGSVVEPRYRQLVTIRGYLREQLAREGEQEAADRLMAEAVAAIARGFVDADTSPEALDALERELSNLRAALAVLVRLDPARAVELAADLLGLWRTRHEREGREWLERALAAGGAAVPVSTRARGEWGAGVLAHLQGDADACHRHADASLADARETEDPLTLARALYMKGLACADTGDAAAAGFYRESLELCERIGDSFGVAVASNDLGELARAAGDHDAAIVHYERAYALTLELGDDAGTVRTAHNLALSAAAGGDRARAIELLLETLAVSRRVGRQAWSLTLAALVSVAPRDASPRAVAALLGAARAAMEAAHTVLEPVDAQPLRDAEAALAAELGGQMSVAEARGRALSEPEVERLVARIFDSGRTPEAPPLTRRELDVVRLIAAGLTNGEIAERLVLSDHTVHRHVANILGKLDVPSRAAAASVAAQLELL